MESYAELIAAHAVAMLLLATGVLLLLTTGLWRLLQRHGSAATQAAVSRWRSFAGHPFVRALTRTCARARGRCPLVSGAVARVSAVGGYLGVEALLGFTVALVASGVFFELADEIGLDEDLGRFDDALARGLGAHVSRTVIERFALITRLGDFDFLGALCVVVALVLLWRRRWVLAGAWVLSTSLGGVLNRVLKALFERARPVHEHGLIEAHGWSFPSGHAFGAMLVYGLLGYLIIRGAPRAWHIPVALVTTSLIVFVGFSRVILQVHYFSDVIAGYASAAAWLAVWIAGLEAVRWRARQSRSSVPGRA